MPYISTPHQAELNARDLMRSWGYLDAVATTGGSDGGIDVRSSRALAQVKWKSGVTGRPDVQNLVGARGNGTEQLIFFSASSYSKQAIEYADQMNVALFTYDPTGAAEPVNPAATSVMRTVPVDDIEAPTDWLLISVLAVAAVGISSLAVIVFWS